MKILHVIQRYWPYVGGSEGYFQAVGERLAAAGHDVTVYTTTAWDLEYFWSKNKKSVEAGHFVHNGVKIVRFPVRHMPVSEISYPGMRRVALILSKVRAAWPLAFAVGALTPLAPEMAMALAFGRERFDVVHAGNIPFDAVVSWAQIAARRHHAPFVMTPFTHLGEPNDDTVRRHYTMPHQIELMRNSDAVIVQTSIEAKYLTNAGVPRRAIRRGGVGIEPSDLAGGDRERYRTKHNIQGPVVYFIGTLAHDKGVVHLVEAMRRLWDEGREGTLVLAGPSVSQFETYWDSLPESVKARCRKIGVTVGQEKRDLLAAGDVCAMPSRTDSFGNLYLEAWFYNTPVIGASAGGVAEVIEAGRTGELAPFGDVSAIASLIAGLLDNPDRARALGEAGHAKTMALYTWDAVVGRVKAVYDDVRAGAA